MPNVRYTGPNARGQVTEAQWKAAGFSRGATVFQKSNGYTVNLPVAEATWLASQPDFQAVVDVTDVPEYQIAYIENAGGVVKPINAVTELIPNMVIVVPPDDRELWVEFGFAFNCTTQPTADQCSYVAGMVGKTADFAAAGLVAAGGTLYAGNVGSIPMQYSKGRLGPLAVETTLHLGVFRSGNANFRGNVLNGNTSLAWKTWMAVYAR